MMVHDQLSGYVHEVPDTFMGPAVGEVVYDGLGNALGWNPFSAISSAVRGAGNLVSNIVRGAGNVGSSIVRTPFNILGSGINAAGQAVDAAGRVISGLLPGQPGYVPPPPGVPAPYPTPGGSMYPYYRPPYMNRPLPAGWMRSNLPYTGLGPRRMYMRCAVWPGPAGLVPSHAANMPPGGMPGMPGGFGGGRRRRRRRR